MPPAAPRSDPLPAPFPALSPPPTAAQRQIRHYIRQRAWCEWEEFDNWPAQVAAALDDPAGAAWPPFHLLGLPGLSAAQHRLAAQRWMRQRLADSAPARQCAAADFAAADAAAAPRAADRPLRIGYLSSDFHDHATAYLLVEAIEAHNPLLCEPHAYCHGPARGGAMRQRLQQAFAGFHDIAALGDEAAARQIHADGIDILVDLKGFTADSRSMLLAWRPAPLQVSFLGYPGTLGGTLADYLITDRFVTPEADAAHFSEALAYLPHSYQPHPALAAAPTAAPADAAQRQANGLPVEGLVWCCFNQAWKFTPAVFDSWCRLLMQVPGSVLWLLHDEQAQGNLRREAFARGIARQRLVFAPALPQAAHLLRLRCADIVLDTWPYDAHTTASDALAAGVPVLTWAGASFAARVAGSLLHAVGLPDLVADDLAHYEALALALAHDAPRRLALRQRLADGVQQSPLCDVAAYAVALQALYQAMWLRHRRGQAPAMLGRPQLPQPPAT